VPRVLAAATAARAATAVVTTDAVTSTVAPWSGAAAARAGAPGARRGGVVRAGQHDVCAGVLLALLCVAMLVGGYGVLRLMVR